MRRRSKPELIQLIKLSRHADMIWQQGSDLAARNELDLDLDLDLEMTTKCMPE